MTIDKLKSGTYRIRQMYKGKVYTVTLDHKPTMKEATLLIAQKLEEVDNSSAASGTFKACAEEYVSNRANVLSPNSVRTYERYIKSLSNDFSNINIYDITQETVQKEINRYAKKHQPKGVRSLHGFISAVMRSYRPNFNLHTTLPQKVRKARSMPSSDDIRGILELAKGTDDYVGIQLGVLSLRVGEICALELSDLKGCQLSITKNKVYNKGWFIKQTPKTDAGYRTIQIPEQLADTIRKQGYIYSLSPQKLNQHLHNYQDALGIPRCRFHDLRRYFASYASTMFPEADVMALGGWKSDYVFKEIYRDSLEESRKETSKQIADKINLLTNSMTNS